MIGAIGFLEDCGATKAGQTPAGSGRPSPAHALASERLINASVCHHHFVSSWVQHNGSRHNATDRERRVATHTTVPVGLAFRTSNEWRSFELNASTAAAREEGIT